jgi:hypothetical protein
MASSKHVKMSTMRHRKICALLNKWNEKKDDVAKNDVTAEACKKVCMRVCTCASSCQFVSLLHTNNCTHTRSELVTYWMLTVTSLGAAGDAGIPTAIHFRPAYLQHLR